MIILVMGYISIIYAEEMAAKGKTQSFWETYTAALRGDKSAQFETGVIYERGIGVDINHSKAAEWYLKSAEQGHLDAQYNIAIMYVGGRGVEQNISAGMMWLASAAKQGDDESRKLLLQIIDGKLDKAKSSETNKKIVMHHHETILPVRLKTKDGALICTLEGNCIAYQANTTITSKVKSGKYYKISGIGGKNGWQPYVGEGWIEEKDIQRE